MTLRLHENVSSFDKEVDALVSHYRDREKDRPTAGAFVKVRTRVRGWLRKAADVRVTLGKNGFHDFKAGYEAALEAGRGTAVAYAVLQDDAVLFWKPETLSKVQEFMDRARKELKDAKNLVEVREVHRA